MPAPTFSNSLATSGLSPAWVETGVVANVNVKNLTIDWVSQYTGKQITDLQIMTPYLHFNNGEGFTCVPETGAICVLCFPSDDESPFVMGFLAAPENEGADVGDVSKKITDPGTETEEGKSIKESNQAATKGTTSGGSTASTRNVSDASYRAGRPLLNPGDMLWQGRDENFVILRRGGVLQIGATQIAQRIYVPIRNYIRDFCENYELNTAAGSLSWETLRQENNPSGDAPTELVLLAREHAQDKKASIKISVGSLEDATKPPGGDTTFLEVVVAPESIAADDGKVSGTPEYVLRIDKSGNTYSMQAGKRTVEVKGGDKLTVTGNRDVSIKGNQTTNITGNDSTTVVGNHALKAAVSKETILGIKTIMAAKLNLGDEVASEPAVLGLKLVAWLKTHVHKVPLPTPATPTLTLEPVTKDLLDYVVSKRVFFPPV
jgi:hypothetical protein